MQGINLEEMIDRKNNIQVRVYACDEEQRAEEVSDFLVNNWLMAERFLKGNGINFICVLQPNPYTLKEGGHYDDVIWRKAVSDVYPKIIKKVKKLDCFEDGRAWITNDHYIDACCHLNSKGNDQIANELHEAISRRLNILVKRPKENGI